MSRRPGRAARFRSWASGAALALACLGSWAGEHAYEPVALGWSPDEVERAVRVQYEAIAERARATQRFGCERHCALLQRVFRRLEVQARSQSPRADALPWSLTVVRLDDVEAMALPSGQIVVSENFIDANALDEAALAFVVAHEMAHSILEHERQSLTFARMLLPSVPRSVRDMYVELDLNYGLLKSMEIVMQSGEYEADELGLLMASEAGYLPEAQLGFLIRESMKPPGPRPMIATHPGARQRLERLQAQLPLAWRVREAALPGIAAGD